MTQVRHRSRAVARVLAAVVAASPLGASVVHLSAVVALLVPATVGVLLLLALVRHLITWPDEAARRRILWWTMVAFGSHLLFGMASTNINSGVRFFLAADSFTYDALSR